MDVLDQNSRFLILLQATPQTVLQLCQTESEYADICRDNLVFIRLMKEHYPRFPVDHKNPKEQYIKITGEEGTIYRITIIEMFNAGVNPLLQLDNLAYTVEDYEKLDIKNGYI